MAPLPGLTPPNAPGAGSPSAPQPASIPAPVDQHPQGARVPTGLPYGQRQALQNAQRVMPVSGGAAPTPPPPPPGPPTAGTLPPDHPAVLQAAQNFSPPIRPLTRPTDRPFEPIQSGIRSGPGPGPEALLQPAPNAQSTNNLSALLAQIAQQSGSQAVAELAQKAAANGQ